METLQFILNIKPPTATAQIKKVAFVNGKPFFYPPKNVKEARKLLSNNLMYYIPKQPLTGAISLKCIWKFSCSKNSHKINEFRITKPDTDNLQKLLKDVMTQCGFWIDDAQVCVEHVEKLWVSEENQGIEIEVKQIDNFKNW